MGFGSLTAICLVGAKDGTDLLQSVYNLSGKVLPTTLPNLHLNCAYAYLRLALIPLLYASSGDDVADVTYPLKIRLFRHIFSTSDKYGFISYIAAFVTPYFLEYLINA